MNIPRKHKKVIARLDSKREYADLRCYLESIPYKHVKTVCDCTESIRVGAIALAVLREMQQCGLD